MTVDLDLGSLAHILDRSTLSGVIRTCKYSYLSFKTPLTKSHDPLSTYIPDSQSLGFRVQARIPRA